MAFSQARCLVKGADKIAIKIIINVIKLLYGYDFQHYSMASLKRRLVYHQNKKQLPSLADMIPFLINDPHYFDELLSDISITVTEMFRDPGFYCAFREIILPSLKTYSYVKLWHAGCSTGEEVYSMAILLHENDFLERAQIYATDFNPCALALAKNGIYEHKNLERNKANYLSYGGKVGLDHYYTGKYNAIKMKNFLKKRMAFSKHDLCTDHMFNEVEVIICRNVMIYFSQTLKERALNLFYDSLVDYGYLCLGTKEMINYPGFKEIDPDNAIYQKVPL